MTKKDWLWVGGCGAAVVVAYFLFGRKTTAPPSNPNPPVAGSNVYALGAGVFNQGPTMPIGGVGTVLYGGPSGGSITAASGQPYWPITSVNPSTEVLQ